MDRGKTKTELSFVQMGVYSTPKKVWGLGVEKPLQFLSGSDDQHPLESSDEKRHLANELSKTSTYPLGLLLDG
jgi:hypothetical protein